MYQIIYRIMRPFTMGREMSGKMLWCQEIGDKIPWDEKWLSK
jgi:hypothetical protein